MVNKLKNGIVFIKTPKSSSTTVASYLKILSNFKPLFKLRTFEEQNQFPDKGSVNLQHLKWRDVNQDMIDINNMAVISCIREPLSRMKSHFRHKRDKEGHFHLYGNDFGTWYENCHLNTKLENGDVNLDNYISQYWGISDVNQIKNRFDFIFITEYMNKSTSLFSNKTGIQFESTIKNISDTTDELLITKEQEELFIESNKLDYEIYEFVINNYL